MKILFFIAYILYSSSAYAVVSNQNSESSHVKIYDIIRSVYNSTNKADLIANIFDKYPWISPSVFSSEINKEVTLKTSPNTRIKILSNIKNKTDRQEFLLWDAKQSSKPDALSSAWLSADLTPDEEKVILQRYRALITESLLKARLSNLSWMQKKANIDILKIALTQAAKKEFDISLTPFSNKAKNNFKANEYRTYLYVSNLIKSEHYLDAFNIIKSMSLKDLSHLQSNKWWKTRHILARELMKQKKYSAAYDVAKNHGTIDPSSLTDAEWLSGWICLKFLHNPLSAITHFHKVFNYATMSDTRAKAAYWLWKAYLASKNTQEAEKWLQIATSYQGFFYGQVAAISSGKKFEPFAKTNHSLDVDKTAKKHVSIGVSFYRSGIPELARKFIIAATEYKMNHDEAHEMASIIEKLNDYELNVLFAKKVANNHNINLESGYPTHLKINGEIPSLYYGIIRQESNFNHKAVSPVGAYGLMQLMPKTAAMLSKKLGIPTKSYKHNINHNIASGSAYLDMLRSDFNQSYIASISSYNAGKANVKKWSEYNGNVNHLKTIDHAIDWIESIPFGETRFYVKKVIANIITYDHILTTKHGIKPKGNLKSYLS